METIKKILSFLKIKLKKNFFELPKIITWYKKNQIWKLKKLKYLMKKKSLVSILIINYNNEKYLDRAIKSCINQTYKI